jgi:hypothetical protein
MCPESTNWSGCGDLATTLTSAFAEDSLRSLTSTEKGSASLAFFCFALLLSRTQHRSDSNPNISKFKKPTLGELF